MGWIRHAKSEASSASSWNARSNEWAANAIRSGNFDEYCNGITHNWLRTMMILVFFFMPIFFILDVVMMPAALLPRFAVYRGVSVLIALAQFFIVINTRPSRWSFLHGYIASLNVGGIVVLMTVDLGGFSSGYYAGLNLVVIAANLLMPWGAWHTAANALMVLVMYVGANLPAYKPQDMHYVINNIYFMSATIVIIIAINYLRFQLMKKEFSLLVEVEKASSDLQREKEIVEDRNRSIKSLLDLSGQGFLSFDDHFNVSHEYSKECERIFGHPIDGARIDTLLFSDPESQSNFQKGLELYFDGETKADVIFDLLDAHLAIGEKSVETEYKAVDERHVMVVLTDKTREVQLLEKSRKENERWNLLRKVISNRQAFLSFVREATTLFVALETRRDSFESLVREIHTLKASAGFMGFGKTQEAAHEFENFLTMRIALGEEIRLEEQAKQLKDAYSKEIAIVFDALGSEWNLDREMVELPRDEFLDILNYIKKNCAAPSLIEKMEVHCKKPLSQLMARFPDMASDLAVRLGKRLTPLVITGGEVLVDLEEYEELIESFSHMIRNMVDHGIEPPDVRLANGKSPMGSLNISIREVDNDVEFTFSDDGNGISFTGIAEKARRMGLLKPDDAPTSSELLQLIFRDNFSTKVDISDISGRGVGLSAVRHAVYEMGGRIEVHTAKNRGTSFKIIVPKQKQGVEVAS